ncbi:2-oxo acid dehydrogenase subunit E2 [bacterium]|nr:MAG: 2-oxo acid dehydrogenase subunit E2 [bacterium]
MATPVIMPRQGQSVETCIITTWLKHKGDPVKTGDILFSYETDKASFDTEAPADGVLLEVFFNEGDEVPVLTNVAVIGKAGEDVELFRTGNKPAIPQPEIVPASQRTNPEPELRPETSVISESQVRISPRARVMAKKMGIDPQSVTGTGPNGRIIARDIESYSEKSAGDDFEDIKVSNVRKIIARAMHESLSRSAQLTHHMSADARKILALRKQTKSEFEKNGSLNITLNDMVCFSVIRALEKHPDVNGHFLGESIRRFRKIHLGLAVDTPRGLMVPVVRNAGELSLNALSGRLREIAEQCRKGNIMPEMLSPEAASFTVSNLGNYGVEMFTPVINLPQIAILGVNTIIQRPAEIEPGIFGFVPVIGLSLTYDHRAIDGGPATLFLKEIKEQIENFQTYN